MALTRFVHCKAVTCPCQLRNQGAGYVHLHQGNIRHKAAFTFLTRSQAEVFRFVTAALGRLRVFSVFAATRIWVLGDPVATLARGFVPRDAVLAIVAATTWGTFFVAAILAITLAI